MNFATAAIPPLLVESDLAVNSTPTSVPAPLPARIGNLTYQARAACLCCADILRSVAVRLCPVTIGRDDLIALAERRVREVAAGRGHLLLLAGEAGIGKTRLLGEIRGRAVGHG